MDVQHFVRSLVLLFFILEVFFSVSLSRNVRYSHQRHRHHQHDHSRSRHRRHSDSSVTLGSAPVNESGPWGPWGESGECSRTCGGGVALQTRKCLHVRHDGSHGCFGPSKKYFSCNIQDCPEDASDFRAEQCSQFDDVAIEGRFNTWIPYHDAPNKCELNCVPQGERVYYRHAKKVIDGTRCDQDSLDICVDGVCMPVGCDMMLGSNATEDHCRDCGGDGSSCKTLEGVFDLDNLNIGYNDILLIPSGATNIHIQERRPTNNYLAVRNLTGHYYLNGYWRIDFPRDLHFAGTTFHYNRKPNGFQSPESLKALGPTNEPIYLVLLYQESNPGIVYEYSIPNGISPVQPDSYSWIYGNYEECSKTCGGGYQVRTVNCARASNFEVVPNYLCESTLQPPSNRSCNVHSCPPLWHAQEWEECSVSCGGGTQYRMVYCQQMQTEDTPTIVNNNLCLKSAGPRPPHIRTCHEHIVCPIWHSGPWSPCNKICGNGEQSRSVTCHKLANDIIQVFPDNACDLSTKPQSKQKCNTGPCEGVDWIVSDWSGCDTCGLLRESRLVYCSNKSGTLFPEHFCDHDRQPDYLRDCPDSASCENVWVGTQWSVCSATCGTGIQTRIVFCAESKGSDIMKKVPNENCNPLYKYDEVRNCTSKPCTGVWFSGPWNRCTAPCSGGHRTRKVVCLLGNDIVEETLCDPSQRPFYKETCNTDACDEDEMIIVDGCKGTKHGCCPDNVTAAGPNFSGCPEMQPTSEGCELTQHGCCPDGVTIALGPFKNGCVKVTSCEETKFKCCPDGVSAAKGPKDFGCPDPTICSFSTFGCCPDGVSSASGKNFAGCTFVTAQDCESLEYGCCLDGYTPAQGPNLFGCDFEGSGEGCEESTFGCCPDGITPALDPEKFSCLSTAIPILPESENGDGDCDNTKFGCCPDLINEALGFNYEGCPKIDITPIPINCEITLYGCCPDKKKPALGPADEGCEEEPTLRPSDCLNTLHGCCPDGKTAALGFKNEGCDEESTTKPVPFGPPTLPFTTTPQKTEPSTITATTQPSMTTATTESSTLSSDNETSTDIKTTNDTETSTDPSQTTASDTTNVTGSTSKTSPQFEDCSKLEFGCCEDAITPANGTNKEGCPQPSDCTKSKFGCCPDGTTEATGPEEKGCPESNCSKTKHGCCPDKKTTASGPNFEGCLCESMPHGCCPDGIKIARGVNYEGCGCELTAYGCCEDGSTEAKGPNLQGCGCLLSEFGCCPDGETAAAGSNYEGCCQISPYGCCPDQQTLAQGPDFEGCSCDSMTYGCCPDDKTQAKGTDYAGCPCESMPFGCCPDGVTIAQGTENEGCDCHSSQFGCCPDGETPAEEVNHKGCDGCKISRHGCCPDGETPAQGPNHQGCGSPEVEDCEKSDYGCCPDGRTPAEGFHGVGCEGCKVSKFGCCPDGHTSAEGPGHRGCETCESSPHGCCGDGKTFAEGPNQEGCTCESSKYGCCPDGKTEARGHRHEGCGCETTYYGCCPDGKTPAQGENEEGCQECESSPYGCCADGQTAAEGPNQEGCGCRSSRWGCCPDGSTFARGPNQQGCTCEHTRYGCCPDGTTPAKGLAYEGCFEIEPKKMKAGDVCGLTPDTGSCRTNYTVKWHFDMEYGDCNRFWYGGCDGNDNRFDTEEDCKQVCVIPEGMDACQLPKVSGPCKRHTVLWYYDVPSGQCGQFYYGGCLGNNNRFATKEECEMTCADTEVPDPCLQPKLEGPCNGEIINWYYDQGESMCKQFRYGGCKGNHNNFPTERECVQQCASRSEKDACVLPKESGPCGNQFQRWYYDVATSKCKEFIYGGCQGNINRFISLEQCQNTCNNTKVGDICALPKAEGPCREQVIRWYYDSPGDRCLQFYYGGCEGNANRFETENECQHVCSALKGTVDICSLSSDHGPCSSASEDRWFYDQNSGRCRSFVYGGCGGNENNFVSQQECEFKCAAVITVPEDFKLEDCHVQHSYGRCEDNLIRWFYDKDTGVCKQFYYSGCNGNKNRFGTRQECEQKCFPSQDTCQLPKVAGPCTGKFRQWYYNAQNGHCEEFDFSGCEGNPNKFSSREACEDRCKPPVTQEPETTVSSDPCLLSRDAGPCSSNVLSWYFDETIASCRSFLYGGCGGNTNRFVSEESCDRACGKYKGHDVCSLPKDPGPCLGEFNKWYHDAADNVCKFFVFGGCSGNGNRFNSKKECEQVCVARKFYGSENETEISLAETCRLPLDVGPCREAFPRWFYDSSRDTCVPFTYGGCGGNKNRFKTFETCIGFCSTPTCPEAEECSVLNCPFGIEEYRDNHGCTRCRCKNPCQGIFCPEETTCVVEMQQTLHGESRGHPVCRRTNVELSHTSPPEEITDPGHRVAPYIDPSEEELRIRTNHTVRIPCIVHGDPRPFVYWRKDGEVLAIDDHRIRFTDDHLEILDVSQADAGIYSCTAESGYGTPAEKSTSVVVEEPARIVPGVRIVVVAVGTPCTLHCNAVGYPRPSVTWYRGYLLLPTRSEQYEQFTNFSLLINTVRESDYGGYSCKAYNGIGDPAVWEITLRNPDSDEPGRIPTYTQRPLPPPYPAYPYSDPRYPQAHSLVSHHPVETRTKSQTVVETSKTPPETESPQDNSEEVYYYYEEYELPPNDAMALVNSKDLAFEKLQLTGKYLPIVKDVENVNSDTNTKDIQIDSRIFESLVKYAGDISVEAVTSGIPAVSAVITLHTKRDDSDDPQTEIYSQPAHETVILPTSPSPSPPVPVPSSDILQELLDSNKVSVTAELKVSSTSFPVDTDVRMECLTNGSEQITWFKDETLMQSNSRVQIIENGTLVIYSAQPSDTATYKCEASNKNNAASSSMAIVINGFKLHANCTDNPYFANCKLVVQANFCSNQYYARFCCKSCTLAGQLPVFGPHLQTLKKKK